MAGGSTDPIMSGGEVSGAMRLATTFARKSERLSRTFLYQESAICKQSFSLVKQRNHVKSKKREVK